MEFISGDTLYEQLNAGSLPLPEALRIAAEVAEALEEAHNNRFVTLGTFAALGALLGFGRALLLAGTLLRGGLLRRDLRALCRNGGGFVGGFVVRFCVVHGCVGYPFLRLLRVLPVLRA